MTPFSSKPLLAPSFAMWALPMMSLERELLILSGGRQPFLSVLQSTATMSFERESSVNTQKVGCSTTLTGRLDCLLKLVRITFYQLCLQISRRIETLLKDFPVACTRNLNVIFLVPHPESRSVVGRRNEKKRRLLQAKRGKDEDPLLLWTIASCVFGQYVVVNWCEIVFHVDRGFENSRRSYFGCRIL